MANIFKGIRTTVKIVAAVISIAFLLNSVNGGLSAMQLANGDSIKLSPINPGDFKIDYSDLDISVGINVTNPGIYDLTDIVVGMKFELKPGSSGNWTTILNNNSVDLGQADTPTGDTIATGATKEIGLQANMTSFATSPAEIGALFSLPPNWTLSDLMQLPNDALAFESRLTLTFSISYAYKQYVVAVEIVIDSDAIQGGLV